MSYFLRSYILSLPSLNPIKKLEQSVTYKCADQILITGVVVSIAGNNVFIGSRIYSRDLIFILRGYFA